ncbi:cytochrome P450 family protein [Rhizoctonia solani]|uniref:Cytochrome P450 family protein n=1 Tax=Rhizoctonia solani TaxID=456999 RepID=A0A8H8SW45_9AGAM|nr:cytochrome P450 family protein [Rhizoctonia solani]QRW20636.1 cytochrome P450 family protein [Rhizoctonia solani]
MPRLPIVWGAGLSIALGSLQTTVLPPAFIVAAPSVIDYMLPHELASRRLKLVVELSFVIRIVLALAIFVILRILIGEYQRNNDRSRFGPNVMEVPRVNFRWPFNLDFIRFDMKVMKTGYCGATWEILVAQYGNIFNLRLLKQDFILTVEPEVVKHVLSTDFHNYVKGNDIQGMMFSVLGGGIFNSDGEAWRIHRSMSRPYFTRIRVTHFDNFVRHTDIAISKLLSRMAEPNRPAVDFQDLACRFTLDSGTEFLFGEDVGSLDAPLLYPREEPKDDSTSFGAAFARVQNHVTHRIGLPVLWPWMELFYDRTAEDMKIINAYVAPILGKREKSNTILGTGLKPSNKDGQASTDTLLRHLFQFTGDETVIRDEIINILVAARDTTAAALTFAVYMLSQNPEVMNRLRDEIISHLGASSYPTPEDLKEMKYLRAFLNETLRLFPPVPSNTRVATRSTVLKLKGGNYFIPAGTRIIWSTLLMHRRKDLWGPDADKFDPDRWLDDRFKAYVMQNPFIFLPFNAGPRVQFAYNEVSFFLCRLLQRVESIELAPDAQPQESLPPLEWKNGAGRRSFEKVWPKQHLTMYCDGGLWLRMKEVDIA